MISDFECVWYPQSLILWIIVYPQEPFLYPHLFLTYSHNCIHILRFCGYKKQGEKRIIRLFTPNIIYNNKIKYNITIIIMVVDTTHPHHNPIFLGRGGSCG